ncbi:unnamed protein product [Prunus armeniaca]
MDTVNSDSHSPQQQEQLERLKNHTWIEENGARNRPNEQWRFWVKTGQFLAFFGDPDDGWQRLRCEGGRGQRAGSFDIHVVAWSGRRRRWQPKNWCDEQ